jgi:hypothetical protein
LARRDEEEGEMAIRYVDKIAKLSVPNVEYVLRRVGEFVKIRRREAALLQAAEKLEDGELDEADVILHQALKTGVGQIDVGIDYITDTSYKHQEPETYEFSTGVSAMDALVGGHRRGWLTTTLGGFKAGKTWYLMNLARAALFDGFNVYHASMENSVQALELRYDMMFTGRGVDPYIGKTYSVPAWEDLYRIEHGTPTDVTVQSVLPVRGQARKLISRFGGRLRIKKYPAGQCSPRQIEADLEYLEAYEQFIPDIILLDYVDIMDLSAYSSETRHQLNAGYLWAKGLADERNVLVATVSQVNRAGLLKRYPSPKDVAEDIRKAAHIDMMLAIGRGNEEVRENIAGFTCVYNRHGKQDCSTTIGVCYEIGQFCFSSRIGGAAKTDASTMEGDYGDDDSENPGTDSNGGPVRRRRSQRS